MKENTLALLVAGEHHQLSAVLIAQDIDEIGSARCAHSILVVFHPGCLLESAGGTLKQCLGPTL